MYLILMTELLQGQRQKFSKNQEKKAVWNSGRKSASYGQSKA